MMITTKNNGCPKGDICEQFAYIQNTDIYPNSSYMNELSEILHSAF